MVHSPPLFWGTTSPLLRSRAEAYLHAAKTLPGADGNPRSLKPGCSWAFGQRQGGRLSTPGSFSGCSPPCAALPAWDAEEAHSQHLHPDLSQTRGEKETEAQRPVKGFTGREHSMSGSGKASSKQINRCDGVRGLCLVRPFLSTDLLHVNRLLCIIRLGYLLLQLTWATTEP